MNDWPYHYHTQIGDRAVVIGWAAEGDDLPATRHAPAEHMEIDFDVVSPDDVEPTPAETLRILGEIGDVARKMKRDAETDAHA